jgi:predicted amidohydrolase YtcJ
LEWAGQWRLQPAIHAIGDRANRVVLDAYERALRASPQLRELRPRMEHAQVVSPQDWARFAQLGVVPSMQPVHLTSDMPWAGERLGAERLRGAYAWKSLAPDLTQLAFGSDFPVESPDPLAGLYSARTRAIARSPKTFEPSTALTGAQALAAFTQGAAYAVGAEAHLGRLSPGYRCDVTVLSVDPVACEPQALQQARVLHTIIDGRLVYTRGP